MPRRALCVCGGRCVYRALGPQVVCGGGVCVRVGVCALVCGRVFAVGVTRLPRVRNGSSWVGIVLVQFLLSRVRIVSCNWLCYITLVLGVVGVWHLSCLGLCIWLWVLCSCCTSLGNRLVVGLLVLRIFAGL